VDFAVQLESLEEEEEKIRGVYINLWIWSFLDASTKSLNLTNKFLDL
jgi:hypothetical protein